MSPSTGHGKDRQAAGGVTAADPLTYVGLAAVILTATVIASLIPALRATRVDPMVALRSD